jgi:hypothetical protein
MKIYKNILNKEQKTFLNDIFKYEQTPFYLATYAVKENDQGYHFVHHAIHRNNLNVDNSDLAQPLRKLLFELSPKLKINFTKIYRCALNITFYNGFVDRCLTHQDHPFNHKQILIYLNDSDGETVILDKKNKKEVKKINPETYKILVMDNRNHYQFFPTKGIRKVLVYTTD